MEIIQTISNVIIAIGVLMGVIKFDWFRILCRRIIYTGNFSLKLIRDKTERGPVYFVVGKSKYHIETQTTLYALGYKHDNVAEVEHQEAIEYKDGPKVNIKKKLSIYFLGRGIIKIDILLFFILVLVLILR